MSLLPEIKIKEHHVGVKVTHMDGRHGTIVTVNSTDTYPVCIRWGEPCDDKCWYRSSLEIGGCRKIFIGHNVKITVEEEILPTPKLICPVCGVEHEIRCICLRSDGNKEYDFHCYETCPLYLGVYRTKRNAEIAMKSLIKAFKEK